MDWVWELIKQYGLWVGLAAVVLWWLGVKAIPAVAHFTVERINRLEQRSEAATAALLTSMQENAKINAQTASILEQINRNQLETNQRLQQLQQQQRRSTSK